MTNNIKHTEKDYPKIEGKLLAKVLKVLNTGNTYKDSAIFRDYERSDSKSIVTLNFLKVNSLSSQCIRKIVAICKELQITISWFHLIRDHLILTFYFDVFLSNGNALD